MVVVLPAPVGPTTAVMPPLMQVMSLITGKCLTSSARGMCEGLSRLVRRGVMLAKAIAISGAMSRADSSSSTRACRGSRSRLSFQVMPARPVSSKRRKSCNSRCIAPYPSEAAG